MKNDYEEYIALKILEEDEIEEEFDETCENDRKELYSTLAVALVEEELDFELLHVGDSTVGFKVNAFNPIIINVIDSRHVEFRWESEVLTEVIPSIYFNELTVLKGRIFYKHTAPHGRKLIVEYSLISNHENTEDFVNEILLNSLFFLADINLIAKNIHSDS